MTATPMTDDEKVPPLPRSPSRMTRPSSPSPPPSPGWRKVKSVATVHRMSNAFKTLRSVVSLTEESELQWSDFELVKTLGVGAFGVVTAYKSKSTGETLAVKLLNGQAMTSPAAVADVEAEVKILSKLSHPYLMRLVGVGKVPGSGQIFVASEMLSKGSLQKMVIEASVTPGQFNAHDVTKWMLQAARGLDYLHTRQPAIIHRDLKLANLVLDDNLDVRVIDFGLAKMIGIKKENTFFGGMVSMKKGLSLRRTIDGGGSDECIASSSSIQISSMVNEDEEDAREDEEDVTTGSYADADDEVKKTMKNNHDINTVTPPSDTPLYDLTGCTGSFKYMAPEVFLGRQTNETLDVYSLSIIAYELLTRQIFLAGMRKKMVGYTCAYSAEMWANDAAVDGKRPDLDVVPRSEEGGSGGWRCVLPRMWEEDPGKRLTSGEVVALLNPMHDIYKCTDPNAKKGCCVIS